MAEDRLTLALPIADVTPPWRHGLAVQSTGENELDTRFRGHDE
jgi:hypothetical protein